jgi:hypothetical protein
VTLDGPTMKADANARAIVRKHVFVALPQYFELEASLKKNPANQAVKQEFKVLADYHEFLLKDAARALRHKSRRSARLGLDEDPLKHRSPMMRPTNLLRLTKAVKAQRDEG